MLKLTKTGIGLLTKQYRSVLRKCLFLNLGLFFAAINVTRAELEYLPIDPSESEVNRYLYTLDYLFQYTGIIAPAIITPVDWYDLASGGAAVHSALSNFAGYLTENGNYTNAYMSVRFENEDQYWKYTYVDKTGGNFAENIFLLDSAIGAKIANDGKYIKASNTNSVTANLSALDDAFNYYYTFRVDESNEVTDSASFFQKDFSTLRFGMPTYAFTSSFV